MSKPYTDAELLERLLTEHRDKLTDNQLEAFEGMQDQGYPVTVKQAAWFRGVAERLGIQVAPSENLFSNMDPDKRARQLEAAKKVRLPWE